MNIEKLYEEHKDYIHKLAYEFGRCTGWDGEELWNVCLHEFMKVVQKYDPKHTSKASFKTFVSRCLVNAMKIFINKTDKPVDSEPEGYDWMPSKMVSPSDIAGFRDMINGMSNDARTIVNIIINAPVEILQLTGDEKPKIIRGKLRRYLLNDCGWSHNQVWKAFHEIKNTLRA